MPAVPHLQRTGDAAPDAQRLTAVAACHREADASRSLLDTDVRVHGGALERLHHVAFARIGKRAVILAQMAPKAPLFVHINTFHSLSLVPMHAGRAPLPGRARHRNGRRADQSTIYWSRSAPTETYLIFTPTASSINAIYSSTSRGSSSFFRQPEISVRHPLNILLMGFACSSTSP